MLDNKYLGSRKLCSVILSDKKQYNHPMQNPTSISQNILKELYNNDTRISAGYLKHQLSN